MAPDNYNHGRIERGHPHLHVVRQRHAEAPSHARDRRRAAWWLATPPILAMLAIAECIAPSGLLLAAAFTGMAGWWLV